MSLATYSPEDVVILIGGVYPLSGLSEGSFVSIVKDTQNYTTKVTADGRVSRTSSKTTTHTITLTLASTAGDNTVLSSWAGMDQAIQSAMAPIMIKDGMGTTTFFAPLSWVEKISDVSFEMGVSGREWTIRTAGGTLAIGGNEMGGVIDSSLVSIGMMAADTLGLF